MSTPIISPNEVWQLRDVARAQQDLVTQQLAATAEGNPPAPFRIFLELMETLLQSLPASAPLRLLDVGCGVGHYGVLCARYFPQVEYTGTDASRAMLAQARQTVGSGVELFVAPFYINQFHAYEIVLAGQVMEYLANPVAGLEALLRGLRPGAHAILHRVRLTQDPSHAIKEATYLKLPCQNFLWNENEFLRTCAQYGNLLAERRWQNYASFLLERAR